MDLEIVEVVVVVVEDSEIVVVVVDSEIVVVVEDLEIVAVVEVEAEVVTEAVNLAVGKIEDAEEDQMVEDRLKVLNLC